MNAHNPFDAKQDWTNPYCQNSSNDPMVDALLGNAYHVVRTVYCNLGNLKLLYDFLNQYGMVIGVNSEEELKALSTQVKYSRIYGFSRAGDRQVTDYLYVEGDRTGILPNDTTATGSWITVATSGSAGGGTSSGEGAYIPWVYANGSAAGGETTINVPDGTVGVPFIIINGDMQYVGRGFEFNADSLSVTLAQPLEEGDEVVFLLTGVPAVPDNPNVSDWVQINWLYNNGAAVGGEQVITIPYTFQSIPAVYKNGLRLYKGLTTESYTADPDNQRILLTEPLATNDRLIVQIGGETQVLETSDHTLQEVARATNVKDSEVILSTDTTQLLNGKKIVYSVSEQKSYGLPSLPSNIYISSVSNGQLTYNPGNITVTLLPTHQESNTRELWRCLLAEAGLSLVAGSFEEGATVNSETDAVWHIAGGQCYTWEGALPKVVPADSTITSTGGVGTGAWVSVGDASLRADLAEPTGAGLVGFGPAGFSTRIVEDVLTDCITNRSFGAKCNGIDDDTIPNQQALDWSATNKRTVLFIGKTCITSRLVLNSGARMHNIGSIVPKDFTDTVVIEVKDDKWRSPYNDGITAIQTGNRVLIDNLCIEPESSISAVGIYGTDGVGPVINNARIFNMLNGGVNIEKGYEWKFNNLSVVAPEDQLGTSAISGILHRTSDSMYSNTTVVGYPVGMEITGGANDIVNTHVWGLYGDRSTRVMLIGLKLSGSSNNIINFYSDTPHKLDETQPASLENGGIGYVISGFNNNLVCPRVLFHVNDGPKYGKVFYISGTENSIREPVSSDVSGIEDGGMYVFTGSATPINNYVSGGNLQSFYAFPQSTGFNPTINAPCTYTSQVYRHELTQRNVSGRLTIVCNITSNVESGAFSITLPPYLSSFKGDCTGSIFTMLNNTIRTDTNLIEVNGYITGGKIFFRKIFRSGSPEDVQITDLITGNATIDLSFTCQL